MNPPHPPVMGMLSAPAIDSPVGQVSKGLRAALDDASSRRLHWWVNPHLYESAPPAIAPVRVGWPVRTTATWTSQRNRFGVPAEDALSILLIAAGLNTGKSHPSMVSRFDTVDGLPHSVHTFVSRSWLVGVTHDENGVVLLTVEPA